MKTKRTSLRRDVRAMARGWRWGHQPLVPRSVAPVETAPRDFPTAWARTPSAIAARAALQRFVLKPLIGFETTPRIEGRDVFDSIAPPVIFVANHSSHLDAPVVLTSLPPAWAERTATGAAADYFFDVWWRAAATALVFNAFPVERASTHGPRGRTTRLARELLDDGWNVLVFPEGTRSKDGWVGEFRSGAARLAVDHGVPVVPVALRGTYSAMPRGAGWITRGRPPVRVRFGRAVLPMEGEEASAFNERIRAALAETIDEERSTWWDAQRRAVRGDTPAPSGPADAARWRRVWEASRPLPRRTRAFERR